MASSGRDGAAAGREGAKEAGAGHGGSATTPLGRGGSDDGSTSGSDEAVPTGWITTVAPVAAGLGGLAFLSVSALLGYRFHVIRVEREYAKAAAAAAAVAAGAGSSVAGGAAAGRPPAAAQALARQLAGRALLWGTVGAVTGCTALAAGAAWYFDAYSFPAFAVAMQRAMPRVRDSLEGATRAPLHAVGAVARTAARGALPAAWVAKLDAAAAADEEDERRAEAWVAEMEAEGSGSGGAAGGGVPPPPSDLSAWLAAQEARDAAATRAAAPPPPPPMK